MRKQDFANYLRNQIYSLPDLVEQQVENCFGPSVRDLMSMAEIFDARKIIITGCGDSYAAALAMKPVIEKYCDCFGVDVMRTIEFTRFLSKEEIGIGEPNSPIVIVISVGGSTARACEAIEKANRVGAFSILLTNNEKSKAAGIANRVFSVNTPKFPNDSPGLRSYFASIIGLIAFASRLGHVRGTLGPTGPSSWKEAIVSYVKSFETVLDSIDSQMFELAETWADFRKFDFIGDDVGNASALFGADKFIECCGSICTVDDSEDWCHINYFLKDPEDIGTVVMADKYAPSFGRIVETIGSAQKIGRPVLVITNAEKESFIEGVTVCKLPDTPDSFEWLQPLMDYVPIALLTGYIAKMNQLDYFMGSSLDPEVLTLSTSKIEIFE
ncbi:hypothetical protein [Bacillus sp. JJ1562]|uniref:hypothetical protein n=1 Tax=Bacillus sp. JJ1562 TaxID=3122960 RepID=UPI0030026B01